MTPPPPPHPTTDLSGRRVAVVGAARSGIGCARLLTAAGAKVTVGDSKRADDLNPVHLAEIARTGAGVRPGLQSLADFGAVDMLVVSPGVPIDAPVLEEARERGVEVVGEIELAYRFSKAPVIAVSGTNGKGSTCTLAGEMLNRGGVRTRVCGNIGDPFTGAVAEDDVPDAYVVEVSSFQLETTHQFRPWIGVLLNITPDHLDRHGSTQVYADLKARLFENQSGNDWAILNADDAVVMQVGRGVPGRRILYSAAQSGAQARVEEDVLVADTGNGPVEICRTGDLVRQGRPYIETVLAAASAAIIAGATSDGILEAIRTHKLPDHVLRHVGETRSVTFVDSSKATNPAAAVADLSSIEGPLVVIAGGLDKRVDFEEFGEVLRKRARGLVVLGESADQILEASAGVPSVQCYTIEEAVDAAWGMAQPGDTVALAPACASWDMFASYRERGELFAEAVRKLIAQPGGAGQ